MTKLIPFLFAISFLFCGCKSEYRGDEKKELNKFTFKQGVALNHWAGSLAKNDAYGDSTWFKKEDATWIANNGFDHIQVYVSGREISNPNFTINADQAAILDSLIEWNQKLNIGTVIHLSDFPPLKIDTSLSKKNQEVNLLEKQAAFWADLAEYFSVNGSSLRFNLQSRATRGLTNSTEYIHKYNRQVLSKIREIDEARFVYLSIPDFSRIDKLEIPENDTNIGISCDYLDKGPLNVFLLQHSLGIDFPKIEFPDTIPDLIEFSKKNSWVIKHSDVILDKHLVNNEFEKIALWMDKNTKGVEFYIPHWRYLTGWPFKNESIEDKKSISNFAYAFIEATSKHNVGWCIYDYNSGSPMRYTKNPGSPINSNGEVSDFLNALELNNK